MKKCTALTLFLSAILLLFSSCSNRIRIDENLELSAADNTTVRYSETGKQIYGQMTNTNKTFTGLEPLITSDFSFDINKHTPGSAEKISHSFGVAENSEPHSISIESQMFFDENNFDALTVDLSGEKVVYLTFDVGYDNGYTDIILDTLKEKNVPAAFFCTTDEMKSAPECVARMINEGHIVGNHTHTHPSMDELSEKEMLNELKGFDDYIRMNFGYSSLYFRFPKGEYSENALSLLSEAGYTSVFWSLAYADWDLNSQKGVIFAHDTVISRLHPGAVILLHAVSPDNAGALGDIIDSARQLGYEFVSLEKYKNNN